MKNYLLIIFLICTLQTHAQTWKLVWSDEFDGTAINRKNWINETGGNGWGNNELQNYTTSPNNAIVKDGNLLIIARQESSGTRNYSSARLKTQGLQKFTYGKFEGRMKAPKEQGIWPAFWMLGSNIGSVGWPKCGEIDIMEHVSLSSNINGTMHWQNASETYEYKGGSTPCNIEEYHIYGVEWDAKSIKWFMDGKKYYEKSILNNVNGTSEMHLPFFFILNMAVGGNWPGSPNASTTFPDTLYIDYIRAYQLETPTANEKVINDNEFSFNQNYPNPFSRTTSFTYNIPTKSFVSLKIYDLSGKQVTDMVSEEMPAGNYTKEWDASSMPPGIYFCKIKAGDFMDTKKLVLLK